MEIKDDSRLYFLLKNKKTYGNLPRSSTKAIGWSCGSNSCRSWKLSPNKMILANYPIKCDCKQVDTTLLNAQIKYNNNRLNTVTPYVNIKKYDLIENHSLNSEINEVCDMTGRTCGTGVKTRFRDYVCSHNNLSVQRPNLALEWNYEKNGNLTPNMVPISATIKVWWICSNSNNCGCHQWQASLQKRIVRGDGCGFCSGRYACKHKNLLILRPDIAKEWFYEKNIGKLPENVVCGSDEKVWWKCSKEGVCECHFWKAKVSKRTKKNQGCPFCNVGRACIHRNLKVLFPEIAKEWDYEKNKDKNMMIENIPPVSGKLASWICQSDNNCGCHRWDAHINNRTSNDSGCPFCYQNRPCKHRNVKTLYPKVAMEWDYERNQGILPEECAPISTPSVWWKCSINNEHKWKAPIYSRTDGKNECPLCTHNRYSKIQIEWLKFVMETEHIFIQHAENGGEYYIEGIGKVDGFCKQTNTVYEFHGNFWHGNPNMFDPTDINPFNKKSYGDLYKSTLDRSNKIKRFGYNLIEMWESDFHP